MVHPWQVMYTTSVQSSKNDIQLEIEKSGVGLPPSKSQHWWTVVADESPMNLSRLLLSSNGDVVRDVFNCNEMVKRPLEVELWNRRRALQSGTIRRWRFEPPLLDLTPLKFNDSVRLFHWSSSKTTPWHQYSSSWSWIQMASRKRRSRSSVSNNSQAVYWLNSVNWVNITSQFSNLVPGMWKTRNGPKQRFHNRFQLVCLFLNIPGSRIQVYIEFVSKYIE